MQRLELTWIGKGEAPAIEPRILLHDPSKDYGEPNSGNMLIHGDNLLALKALEQQYAGQVKCIYIDPPYNTGAAFEHYDDNLEHSIWINLMYERLRLLRNLLKDDGVIAIEIDDNEMPYLRIILNEIFGRNKFVAQINVRSNSISGAKTAHKDKTILRNKDNIIVYKKGDNIIVNPQYVRKDEWDTHYNYFLSYDGEGKPKDIHKLKDILVANNIVRSNDKIDGTIINNEDFYSFIIDNKNHIFRLVNSIAKDARQKSLQNPNSIIQYNDDNGIIRFAYNGSRISFLDSAIMSIDDEEAFAQLLGDLWLDIDFQNTQNEGGVSFPTNKKPEALVKRIIDLFTSEGDIVLDSFLGSGTTAAVAQKMQRRYIGIEMGEHAYTHCKIRLDSVIDGTDQSGISRKIGWQGGGGYKFYELAPTLIVQDKYGNPVFSDKYNAEMLVAAVAKINGFYYAPDSENFWKQGFSQDNSYIYVTTQYLTAAMLDGIAAELSPMENLLICSPAFDIGLGKRYDNINVRKIPQSVLSKCEFGADNYNLNIVDAPVLDEEEWEND